MCHWNIFDLLDLIGVAVLLHLLTFIHLDFFILIDRKRWCLYLIGKKLFSLAQIYYGNNVSSTLRHTPFFLVLVYVAIVLAHLRRPVLREFLHLFLVLHLGLVQKRPSIRGPPRHYRVHWYVLLCFIDSTGAAGAPTDLSV